MRRREFMTLVGGAAAWPVATRAQQPAMPVVGFLHAAFPRGFTEAVVGFRQGLGEAGYVEGRNVAIEYRWAEGQYDRLPPLAADLVRRQVAVVFASSPPAARAVKAENSKLPIVFAMGEDPIKEGLVTSLSRPGGNVTGFSWFSNQLFGKRLALLKEIVPNAAVLALLVNPNNPNADPDTKEAQIAAGQLGRQLQVMTARTERDLETVFAAMVQRQVGAVAVGVDGAFLDWREQLVALAARRAIPAIYDRRQYPDSAGLMSYGASQVDSWRQGGVYVGRILKGEKPADMPVQQATKFELIINLKTAKGLGLTIPPSVLAIADEVIE
jgi:putative ABC transport system substrate-binding protein